MNYIFKLGLIISSLAILFTTTPVSSYSFPLAGSDNKIKSALQFLESAQNTDGSIGSYGDTAWSIMAISASGKNPDEFGNNSPVRYLENSSDKLAGAYNLSADLSRNILAIVAAGEDPYSFGAGNEVVPSGDYISALLETFDGNQFGVKESINEDCWAIIALVAAGYDPDDEIIQSTASYIKSNQGPDKGWSWVIPEDENYFESDPDNTAAVIMALAAAGADAEDSYISDGIEFLKNAQGESGGFSSYGVENTGSTAWTVKALNTVGIKATDWDKPGGNPVDALLNNQQENGSFAFATPLPEGYMPMPEQMTANSIVALLGESYPVFYAGPDNNLWLWFSLAIIIIAMVLFLWYFNRRKST